MDFGVARLTTASMTGTGNIVGTADYMSPEQVKGAKVDGRSDLFSVGCMLYELMAGRRPFHSDNLMAIFYKITHEEPNYELIPGGADYQALLPILRKSLAKDLDERYQTAYEFAVDLRDYLKTSATSSSGAHALEGLLDLDAAAVDGGRTRTPVTDVPGATIVTGDEQPAVRPGQPHRRRACRRPSGVGRPPPCAGGAPTVTGEPGPTILHPPTPAARRRQEEPPGRTRRPRLPPATRASTRSWACWWWP